MNNGHNSQNSGYITAGNPYTVAPCTANTRAVSLPIPESQVTKVETKLTDERGKAGTRADRDAPVLQPVMRTIFPFMSTPSATWAADAV